MEPLQFVRLVHIVSASILFGTGVGIAFFMLRAYLSGSNEAMGVTTSNVVLADWIFTAPAVIVQVITGLWLTFELSFPMDSLWFVLVIALFVLVGLCWIPVVRIQIRIRNIIACGGGLDEYHGLMKVWVALGVPAFLGVLALYFLMVSKWGLETRLFT